jgi:hypothetical protein
MSLTYKASKNAEPIAKVKDSSVIIYLLPDSDVFQEIPKKNLRSCTFKCPYCKKVLRSKGTLIYHLSQEGVCPKKTKIAMDTKPSIILTWEQLVKLPLPLERHEIIFVTGPPRCGKTYWVNEQVKIYKALYPNLRIFLFTRHTHDDTLTDDMKNYIHVPITDALIDDPFKLEDFQDSLVIFDDIESSEFPKATFKTYALLDDLCKNGGHYNNAIMFLNQECRMGKKTKALLSSLTSYVIFPKASERYQTENLLREHMGMNKSQIEKIMTLNSRWSVLSRMVPQYVMYEHGIYMLNKDIY